MPRAFDALTADEARRIALAAQGFGLRRPKRPTVAHVLAVAERLQALQIDTVNVLVRAHYLPAYSRLGAYPVAHLDRLTNETHDLIEVRDAHQASYIPPDLEPFLRWRNHDGAGRWRAAVDAAYVAAVEDQVRDRGPVALSDLDDARRRPKLPPSELSIRRKDGKPYAESSLRWGRPSDGKAVLDGLLAEGRLALAGRRRGIERLYDLRERVLPPEVVSTPTPDPADAVRELVRRSAHTLGVATVADLANPFRLKIGDVRRTAVELVEAGELRVVDVEGWPAPAYLVDGTKVPPASFAARALLGPFDSLTWSRERTSRLFGFEFSFEIYVPEAKRRYGYYVLPFLDGTELVARVDLKADRASRTLRARVFAEAGRALDVDALTEELEQLAGWLGLDAVDRT